MKRLLFVTIVLAACGGSDKPAPPVGDHGMKEGKEPALTPELTAFHDALAPKWHADKGDARTNDTCAAGPELATKATAVHDAAPPPNVDAAAWDQAGLGLIKSVENLAVVCGLADRAGFDAAFEEVHNAFHHAMELQIGEHGMEHHEEGMEGMHDGEKH